MAHRLQPVSGALVERVIGVVRVALASSSLFAVWLDPSEPARLVQLTYSLHALYVLYSCVLAAVMWRRDSSGRWPLSTHLTDIAMASVFQYLTLGPSSPFFMYFVFALFSAALRWGRAATIRTAVLVLAAYIAMGISMSRTLGPSEFELARFIIRTVYLMVVTVLLVYLGQHEARLREEIRRLARWPLPASNERGAVVPAILEHAAGIVGAGRVTLVWSAGDEPWIYVSAWPSPPHAITKHPPGDFEPVVPDAVADSTFLCAGIFGADSTLVVSRAGKLATWHGLPAHAGLLPRLTGFGLTSTPFRTDQLSGRVFFTDLSVVNADILPLVEIVGREIGATLDQVHSYEQSRQLAVAEDRIRLARDLHDGVLQSLTGVRLELQNIVATHLDGAAPRPVGDRILAVERALAIEQRELRRFIDDLKPASELAPGVSFADRLDELRSRLALEWRTPITIRVSPAEAIVPDAFDRAVPLMVHEAIVNALKHGEPSRVSVDVQVAAHALRVVVTDDGCGFPFSGRRDHLSLAAAGAGPVSLRERVASLGGEMAIESSAAGSRVELSVPIGAAHA